MVVTLGGVTVEAASLTVTWNAPTTNRDGSSLRDLAGYRLYLGTTQPDCPGSSFHAVSSPTAAPDPGETVSTRVTALTADATYVARLTAVDSSGNESQCTGTVSGVAGADFGVTPSTATSFGTIAVGSSLDRTFTVQNTGGASLSGTASVGAPFRIVTGGSFSLAPGDSQAVTVRFQPTSAGSFAGNATFTADGDTVSRGVNGATTGAGPTPPAPPAGSAPGAPGQVRAPQTAADAGGVTFAVAWNPGSGAASYLYTAAFNDGSGPQQGTVTGRTVQLRMPYHASGAAAPGFVCVRSVSAGGATSADAACTGLSIPARSTSTSPPPTVSSMSPTTVPAGGDGFTLTVNGSGFVSSSVVRWNGVTIPATFVSPTRLEANIGAANLAAAGPVNVRVLTPEPGGGTSSPLIFTLTATAPVPPPGLPSNVTVRQLSADAGGATFAVSWSAGSGATSYRWVTGFDDGSALDQGTVTATSVQLRRPYPASGEAADGFVCVKAVGPTGQASADLACNELRVPAQP